jgi:hypothetical protein
MCHQYRDLGEREDEYQIEEELELGDPVIVSGHADQPPQEGHQRLIMWPSRP